MNPGFLVFAEGGVGLAAGVVYAVYTIGQELLGRDVAPTPKERKLAWLKVGLALFASPLFAMSFTESVLNKVGKNVTWPAVAVFIGISSNAIWPIAVKGLSDDTREWLGGIWDAFRGGGKK